MSVSSLAAAVMAVSIIASPSGYNHVLEDNGKEVMIAIVEEQLEAKILKEEKAEARAVKVASVMKRIEDVRAAEEAAAAEKAAKEEAARQAEILRLQNLTVRPVTGYRISSNFGGRADPITGAQRGHGGTDYALASGAPVMAVKMGTVTKAGMVKGYGNHIIVKHADGVESLYAHLSKINVTVGQQVQAGNIIGKVGSTGRSTGPHLHFEIETKSGKVDGEQWLLQNLSK